MGAGLLRPSDYIGGALGHRVRHVRHADALGDQGFQRLVRSVASRVEHGQHDLHADVSTSPGQRSLPGAVQGALVLRCGG